jgi:YbbR domain-containing protein
MLLSTDIIRPKVQDILPGSTIIQQINPEEITSSFHKEATKCVPIKLCAQWTLEEQYQLVTPPQLTPMVVDIYGPQQAIDAIDSIYTDSLFVEKIVDTKQQEISLVIPEGIRMQTKTTTVTWTAEQFTDKSFTIPIEVEGAVEGEVIYLFPKNTVVTVRVGISHFTEVSDKDIRAICKYPTQTQSTLPVSIEYTNPYITQIRTSVREVEYIIER